MNEEELKAFFAGLALIGLVARNEAPSAAAQMAWQYAEFMVNFKPKDNGQ